MQCVNLQVPTGTTRRLRESVTARRRPWPGFPDCRSPRPPVGCAGVTTTTLRRTRAVGGDPVAVLGIGGLRTLGIQWARAMGFETIAIACGAGRRRTPTDLGAHHYIDSTAGGVAEALRRLGGARVVLPPRRPTRRRWTRGRPLPHGADDKAICVVSEVGASSAASTSLRRRAR